MYFALKLKKKKKKGKKKEQGGDYFGARRRRLLKSESESTRLGMSVRTRSPKKGQPGGDKRRNDTNMRSRKRMYTTNPPQHHQPGATRSV